jgi:S-adenosylmethionine hydrolase
VTITLLSDFGMRDVYVGVMKGVLLSIAPDAALVDLTHDIPAQDIQAAGFALHAAYRYFAPGTIHVAVVDPGVGTARRAVAARIGAHIYLCPDNGLLTPILARETLHDAVVLDKPQYHLPIVSRTFHGRDIFAPAAAHLALGIPLRDIGTPTDTLITLPLSQPTISATDITAHVVHIDVFGNLVLDVTEDMLNSPDTWILTLSNGQSVGVHAAYADVPAGSILALFGSTGHLEIAIRNGHAVQRLGLHVGDIIRLSPTPEAV